MQQSTNEYVCNYCKKDPGAKKGNKFHWNGFKDGDMKILVCWSCRETHYKSKQKTEFKNLYTEFPVTINLQTCN